MLIVVGINVVGVVDVIYLVFHTWFLQGKAITSLKQQVINQTETITELQQTVAAVEKKMESMLAEIRAAKNVALPREKGVVFHYEKGGFGLLLLLLVLLLFLFLLLLLFLFLGLLFSSLSVFLL